MGVKDLLKFDGRETENIGQYTSGKAKEVIKKLGGYGIRDSKVLVDNIIAFTNCSGGAGASTVASNIAWLLTQPHLGELNVLVIDMNILCPIQHVYFDNGDSSTDADNRKDLVDYLMGQCTIGDATITNGRISLMYAVNRTVADEINCEDKLALGNLTALLRKSSELYDIVIIDCPMRVSNALCNTAMYVADTIYTVWDEGISSIMNTDRLRRQLGFTGVDSYAKMKVILNKKTSVKYSKFPFEKLDIELVETVPFSTDVIYSSLNAEVYCKSGRARNSNGADFEHALMSLAEKVLVIGGKTSWT